MFVGAGSVNLKSAIDVYVARCFVSLSGATISSESLPNCLSSLPEQFRARSGTGTTPLACPGVGRAGGCSRRTLAHSSLRRTRRTTAPARSARSKDRSRTAQPVAEPEGRRPLQGRTLRERHHRSDGRDCRQDRRQLRARRRCCHWHHRTAPPLRHRPRWHGPGRAAAGRVRPRHQGHCADAQEPADRGHQGGAGRKRCAQGCRSARRRGRRDQAEAPRHLQGAHGGRVRRRARREGHGPAADRHPRPAGQRRPAHG